MADKKNDDYQPLNFYKKAAGDRQRGFVKFTEGDLHFFTYLTGGDVAMISQGYTSVAGRDNGIESVRKNMKIESRYRFNEAGGKHSFGLVAGNGQEIAISPDFGSEAAARRMAARTQGKAPAPAKKAKPAKAKPAKAKAASAKTDGRIENYKPLSYYQGRVGKIDEGFGSFSDGDAHFFTYHQNGKIVLISESYTSKAGRDNGIKSVRKNLPLKTAYQHHKHKNGKHYFDLNAANKQEIATSVWYGSSAAALAGAAALRGEVKAKPAKAASSKTKKANVEDNYHPLAFYEKHGNSVKDGFDTFEHDGSHYFTYNRAGKIVLLSESYPTKAARETGRASVEKNMKLDNRYDYRSLKNGKHDYRIKAGNGKEVARSVWYGSAAAAAKGAAYLLGKRKAPAKAKVAKAKVAKAKTAKPKLAPIAAAAPVVAAAAMAPKAAAAPRDKDDDYLACQEYHNRPVNDKVNNVALFKHENGKFYFAMYDNDGDVRLRSEGFLTGEERDQELSGVLRLKDDERYYKKITKNGHYMDVLYDETGREVGRSCLKKVAPVLAAAPVAVAAAGLAAAAPAVAGAPAAAASVATGAAAAATTATTAAATGGGGMGFGWLKWLLLALLGLLAIWGLSRCLGGATPVAVAPTSPAAVTMVTCWDGSEAKSEGECPSEPAPQPKASELTVSEVEAAAEAEADRLSAERLAAERLQAERLEEERVEAERLVAERLEAERAARVLAEQSRAARAAAAQANAATPSSAVMGSINRVCGSSSVTLFNVPSFMTPKSVSYLGSNPQFGDSHGLTPSQFYNKLAQRHAMGGSDRAFLNYMARSMGYDGFRSMDASMFSEAVLARGETGLLGFSADHALQYSKLDTNERDRQAFRVRAANGTDVHFMKTCGNFMYVCQ